MFDIAYSTITPPNPIIEEKTKLLRKALVSGSPLCDSLTVVDPGDFIGFHGNPFQVINYALFNDSC